MEHYQFIERELEGIYAALSGKILYDGLKDVETFSINKVIRMVQEQEKIHNQKIISDAEYEDLKSLGGNTVPVQVRPPALFLRNPHFQLEAEVDSFSLLKIPIIALAEELFC